MTTQLALDTIPRKVKEVPHLLKSFKPILRPGGNEADFSITWKPRS